MFKDGSNELVQHSSNVGWQAEHDNGISGDFSLGLLVQKYLRVPTRKLFTVQGHGRHRQSCSFVWYFTATTNIWCTFQRFCCEIYRHSYAWCWDKRSFTSQQQTESTLGIFQCVMLLFRMCWSIKHKFRASIETISSMIQIYFYFFNENTVTLNYPNLKHDSK